MDLSVLIISYNTRDMTLACLASVFEQTAGSFEVIVVDNASADGSADAIAEAFPQVRLVRSPENLGFARANNLAAQHAAGDFLLLLNPDTVVLDHAIDRLLVFARAHPNAGIYGGKTLYQDRSLNPTSCWRRTTPWSEFCRGLGLSALFRHSRLFNPDEMPGWKRDSVREVDIVTGCFLLVRRELWNTLGGFDPAFFMYGEDADLCLRARELGYVNLICPDAEIVHHRGASEPVRADKMVRLFGARRMLARRHWSRWVAWSEVASLYAWALSRSCAYGLASLAAGKHRDSFRTWFTVWSRRREWARRASGTQRDAGV